LHDTRNQLMKGMLISAAFSPDGKILVSGNNSGEAVLWNVDPAAWQEMACATVGRSLTPAEWAIYLPASDPYQPACP
jgi:WD40 repeat protein